MQKDKDMFDLIKETYELEPTEEFVKSTHIKIKESARKLNRRKLLNRVSIVTSGFVISAIAIFFIAIFINKNIMNNHQVSIYNSASASAQNKQEPLIYIYHTNNNQSFYSELEEMSSTKERIEMNSTQVTHPSNNITLVGKRFSESLEKKNINNVYDNTDIMGIMKNENPNNYDPYMLSRKTLQEALRKYNRIRMVFDVQRDGSDRVTTTLNMKGNKYAKIQFVVSKTSYRYDKNLKFAEHLHNEIEKKYPDLSRGVVVKPDSHKQSTYNQELLDQSVLLQIGGVENTLEEEYRTIDILTETIEKILNNN
ncbi:stage II sporulation protein P [Lysinibacillus sp. OL1_EC]|uniref:stage II sporulation protein P n=1 Tax=unclassified Lysinibacillus TaxID=2636778 RepID=UPI00103BEC07|nr:MULTISPECIES: stage II sporulation protein P [unclassified Lysinibacillus]MCM0623638.1 stage II sporulation protein P [Lysinibacillus sp. OL1_EC]TBV89459.1 hypothetical protein EW028_00605 [Lysinibacillus sp. OL1]WBF56010.1 stage II sporulation protein P [Lysinibacillus sp. JK80]